LFSTSDYFYSKWKEAKWQGGKTARWQDGKMARWQGGKMAKRQLDCRLLIEEYFFNHQSSINNHQSPLPSCRLAV